MKRMQECWHCEGSGRLYVTIPCRERNEPATRECDECYGEGELPLCCDVCGRELEQSEPAYNFPWIMTRWGDKKKILQDEIYCAKCAAGGDK